MTEPLQVRQFAIVDHEPVDRGPNAGIFTGRGPTDDRAELYLLAEGTTPAGESFAGHVVSSAGQSWQTLDLSMTGALRKIVKDADESLRAWNRKSIAQHRVSLGLTAVARRGDQVILAQAGPSVAFHRKANRTDIYYTDEEHGAPVGAGHVAEPQLTRLDLEPGDCLLLLSTAALGEMDERLVSDMLGLPAAQLLANIYRRVGALRHVTAILIASGDGPAAMLPPAEAEAEFVIGADALLELAPPEDDPFQPSLFIQGRAGYDVESARRSLTDVSSRARATAAALPPSRLEIPAPLQLAVGDDVRGRLNASVRGRASAVEIAAPLIVPRLAPGRGSARSLNRDDGPPRRDHRARSFTRSLVRGEPAPAAPPISADALLAAEIADEMRARPRAFAPVTETIATENVVSLAPGETLIQPRTAMRGRWHGSGLLHSRRSMAALPPPWIIVLVGLGALLLAVTVIALPRILQSSDQDRLESLIANAEESLANSRAMADPAEKRAALVKAQALLLEARDLSASGTDVARLILEVNESLAVLDAIRQPSNVEQVGSLEQFGDKPVAPTRIVVSTTAAYLLDSASSQVIAITLATGEHRVVYREDAAANRARPAAIAVYESGAFGDSLLLVADTAGDLWVVQASGQVLPLTVAGVDHLTDIAVAGRDLLALDAGATTIFRLSPVEGGFQNAVKVLESPDLAQAQRFSVDGDEVFTSNKNGTLHRFAGKFALALAQSGIDKPLSTAATPWPLAKGAGLALLDAPSDRIVILRLDGTFDHQFRHASFASASALAVSGDRAFVFANGKLWRATLAE